MNIQAMEWAFAETSLSILQKSILVFLASLADEGMFVDGPSQQAIANAVGCSRSAANRALRALEVLGRIGYTRWEYGPLPCAYVLICAEKNMSEDKVEQLSMEWHRKSRRSAG